jgi:hypothetical protein
MKGHAKKYFIVTGICLQTGNLLTYGVYTTSGDQAKKTIELHSYVNHKKLTAQLGNQN